MENPVDGELEVLLRRSDAGDPQALDRLTTLLYDELRRLARRQMRDEHSGHTLQTTALVHEVYLRLAGAGAGGEIVDLGSRAQFLSLAARTMRRVLIDHARAQNRQKRGAGAIVVSLTDLDPAPGQDSTPADLLAIDTALQDLQRFDARKSHLLELNVFGGLTYDELAAATGISRATVHRELRLGRAWLRRELFGSHPSAAPDPPPPTSPA